MIFVRFIEKPLPGAILHSGDTKNRVIFLFGATPASRKRLLYFFVNCKKTQYEFF